MPKAVFETHLAVLCATASLIQTLARKVLRFWATKPHSGRAMARSR